MLAIPNFDLSEETGKIVIKYKKFYHFFGNLLI